MSEELIPVYAVGYYMDGISGDNLFYVTTAKKVYGWEVVETDDRIFNRRVVVGQSHETKIFKSKDDAIRLAHQINIDKNWKTIVCHYGFKQRGFSKETRERNITFEKK